MTRRHLYHPTNLGEHLADRITVIIGSWPFLITQSILLALWIGWNTLAGVPHFDGYPYLFCNILLSLQAAFTGPIVLLAQNRQSDRDRKRDDVEAEEIQSLYATHELLLRINRQQLDILKLLEDR